MEGFYKTEFVIFDVETTGLWPHSGDRIVEVGCLEMVNRRLSGRQLHHHLNPDRASHPDALKVHGLTEAFLAGKPRFAAVACCLMQAWMSSFDISFTGRNILSRWGTSDGPTQ